MYLNHITLSTGNNRRSPSAEVGNDTIRTLTPWRGGKREGSGRPKAPERPKPVSWRPDTQAQRDRYLELGGAAWIRQMIDDAVQNKVDAP